MTGADERISWPLAYGRGYIVTLVVSLLMMTGATAAVWIDPETRALAGWVTLLSAALVALIVATTVPTRYTLTPRALELRAGLYRIRVPWETVQALDLRTSLVSSMTAGCTFQRVGLVRATGWPLELGPADRLGFVAEVLARAPQLQPDPKDPQRSWIDPAALRR